MSLADLEKRLASLPPEKRRLLELRLRKEGIDAARKPTGPPPIPRRDPSDPGPFPLSFGQQRLWFIEQLNPGTAAYNIPFAGRLRGELNPGFLERGLREVVRRHEVLRTRFRLEDGRPVQVIDPAPFVRLPVIDLTALPADRREAENARLILAEPQAPFDLERGPVIRVSLVKLSPHPPAPSPAPPESPSPGEGETSLEESGRAGAPSPGEGEPYDSSGRVGAPSPAKQGRAGEGSSQRPHVGTLRSQLPGLKSETSTADEEHVLLVTMPHLVTDAWSMGILFRELPVIYEALRRGEPSPLPELPIQMADYALWQRAWLQGDVLEEQLRFWRDYLKGAPPVLALPTDRPRPPVQTFRGKRLPMALPPEVTRNLKPFNERRGVTGFMTLLAIVDVFLQRWSGLDDIVVGSPVVTRAQPETHPLIGFFINMAVLRGRLHGDPTFEELLLRVRDSTLASLAHQDLPFERLAETMATTRDSSYPPLVQVSFVLQNVHIPQPEFEGISLVDSWQTDTDTARFDFGVGLFEEEGEGTVPQGGLDYNVDLFDEPTVLRMRGHFLALAAGALAHPERRLSDLPMLSETEQRQLLAEWSVPADPGPGPEASFLDLVLGFAETRPDAPALVGADRTLTYAELAAEAGSLAARLRSLGAGPERGVAVCLERSPERTVAFLAVLAAGGFYLPLDPTWPAERLLYQRRDAGAEIVVTTRDLADRLGLVEEGVRPVFHWEVGGSSPRFQPPPPRVEGPALQGLARSEPLPESLAYVIYTSGSTGRPKGVMISRGSLDNLRAVIERGLGDAPGDAVLQLFSPGFDASMTEIVSALGAGRALHVPRPDALAAGPELAALAEERGATCAHVTPTSLGSVPEGSLASVRCITLNGEAVPLDLVERWAAPGRRLFNLYGPTEATVFCTLAELNELDGLQRPPIGRPVPGARVYVLDARLKPVPQGAHGELCVGGLGVARGYLGRPDLTAEAFVPDPFCGIAGARLYRTGDRVRHRPDGQLDYLGRLDHQVKVRGVRIEPGEIEAVLKEHPAVRDAAVVLREGGDRLIAGVVVSGVSEDGRGAAGLREELGGWLRGRLPQAMVPSSFAFLEALPLTTSGKLDRRALSRLEPEAPAASRGEPALPASERERLLAGIWERTLKLDRVGLHDDFFTIGGDSILAIQVVARAAEAGLYLEPRQLFDNPTIAGMAAVAAGAPRVDAEQGPVSGPVPLTPIQRWFLDEQDPPAPHHWNLSLALDAAEAPDAAALSRAAARLVDHHDMLRARFFRTGAGWRQEIAPPTGESPFTLVDLSALPDPVRESAAKDAAAAVHAGFRLDQGPLLRMALVDLGPGRGARLLLAAHHLVVDGISWSVLAADLQAAAAGLPLPPKTTSFRRWSERLREYARTAELRQELDVWRAMAGPAAPLPVDFPEAGPTTEGRAARIEAGLDAGETRRLLSELPEAFPARVEEVLLTAVAEALAGWRGERAVAIALEGHGRERLFDDVDLSRTVGWFTSLFPVSFELGSSPGASLKAVKERLRRLPRRGIGYGVLRHLADDEAAAVLRRQPLPEAAFNYLGRTDDIADIADPAAGRGPFRLAADPGGGASDPRNPRPHPLEIDAFVLRGELRLVWVYDRARYRRETVEHLAASALGHLRALIAHCLQGEGGEAGYTPTDFPHAGLDQGQLDKLLGKIGRGR